MLNKKYLLLTAFLLIIPLNITNAETYERKVNVELDKEWEIIFNEEINENTVKSNIEISTPEGNIETEIKVKDNKVYVKPVTEFEEFTEYKLLIKTGIESIEGSLLSEQHEVPFVTIGEKESTELIHTINIKNEYNLNWKLSHDRYKMFSLSSDYSGKIVSGYSTEYGYEKNGLKVGYSKNDVITKLGKSLEYIEKGNVRYDIDSAGEYDIYLIDNEYVTYFYDLHENNKIRSIQWVKKDIEERKLGFYGEPTDELREGLEDLMVELINDTREHYGLSILKYDRTVNEVARLHSEDMINNNYFNHVNLKGETPADRLTNAGYEMSTAGENLAYGQFSSIFAHEGLMNSIKHRENILNDSYERVGVGVEFDGDKVPYFTINFYTPR